MEKSYQGVNFTQAQIDILQKDLDLIDKLNSELVGIDNQINDLNKQIALGQANLNSCTVSFGAGTGKAQQCQNQYLPAYNNAVNQYNNITSQSKPAKIEQIKMAQKNYNDDLSAIQNQIKFEIQASLANSAALTQIAANTVAVKSADPVLLAKKVEADAAEKIKSIELQAQLDKQKRDQNVKVVAFVGVFVVVIILGFVFLRRIL